MIKYLKIMVRTMFIIFLITSCKNKHMNLLDDKFLELYYQMEMQEYGRSVDFDKLSEIDSGIIYSQTRIEEINFDKDKNLLWCLSKGDGIEKISIYDIDCKETNYWHIFTTNGGDESADWYDKSIDDVDVETSAEEVKDIFKKFNELNVDSKRALKLMINNKKNIPNYIRAEENIYEETIFYGKYNQNIIIDSPVKWLILYKDETKALLLSDVILDWKRIDSEDVNKKWNDSELKQFVDEDFYNKLFSRKEKEAIIPSDFGERISLLTQDDVNEYFKEKKEILLAKCSPSATMKTEAFKSRKYKDGDYFDYWLRPNNETDYSYININGDIELLTINDAKGIRPIIWVSLK